MNPSALHRRMARKNRLKMTNNGDRAMFAAGVAVILDALGKPFSSWTFFGISFTFAILQAIEFVQRLRARRRRPALGWYRHKLSQKYSEVVGIDDNNLVVIKTGDEEPVKMMSMAFYQMYDRDGVA